MISESPHTPTRSLRSSAAVLIAAVAMLLFAGGAAFLAPVAKADNNRVEFGITDNPGNWFQVKDGPVIGGSRSIAVAKPGVQVKFHFEDSEGVHTTTSLIWPTGAAAMPFESGTPGEGELILKTPGLYVFFCKIHDFMLAGVMWQCSMAALMIRAWGSSACAARARSALTSIPSSRADGSAANGASRSPAPQVESSTS